MKLPEGLPEIRGPWLVAYRGVWAVLALLAVYALTWGGWIEQTRRLEASEAVAELGLALEPAVGGYLVRPLTAEIRAAGVEPYDDLDAVDGRRVSLSIQGVAGLAEQARGERGEAAVLTVTNGAGETREVTVERSGRYLEQADAASAIPQSWQLRAAWLSASLVSLLAFLTAVMLFRRRASDPVAALLATAFVLIVASTAWNTLLPNDRAAAWGELVTIVSGVVCLILGLLVFPTGRFDTRLAWVGAGMLAAAVIGDILFRQIAIIQQPLWLLALLACMATVVRRYVKLPPGPGRQQMKWSMLGLVVFVAFAIGGVGLTWLRDAASGQPLSLILTVAVEVLDVAGAAALMGGLLISMLRHRLYDADAAISRSVSVGAVTIAAVGVFAAAEKLVELVGEQVLGSGAASAVAAALAAVVVLPLHNRLSDWAEARFQGALSRLKRDLPEDLADLRATETVPAIAEEAAGRVREAVQARRTAVLVASEDDWTAIGGAQDEPEWRPSGDEKDVVIDRRDLAYPVRVRLGETRGRTAGWLLIGPRPDGSVIGKAEREAVAEVSGSIGRALGSAGRRSAAMRALTERIERLERTGRRS